MLLPWQTAKVIRIEDAGNQTKRFFLEVPGIERFDFKPGQFVTLDLPIHEQKNKRWRSYSIASWPNGTNVIELVIVLLEDGLGTNYLFNEVKIGAELTFRGPQGVFTLPENPEGPLFLICTGTGIAPFRSMVQYHIQQGLTLPDVHLIFGCRFFSDCLYGPELKELEKKASFFHYHPVFSREKADQNNSDFNTGYVHPIYTSLWENLSAEEKEKSSFYLCGWKNMIDEARERLFNMGVHKKAIHFELYG